MHRQLKRAIGHIRAHLVALVAAATVEQNQYNLPYGHGTSVGFLQLIDLHGTLAWRMVVKNSAGWFLRGARQVDPKGRMAPGRLAQAVQRSGYPDAYNARVAEARVTVRTWLRGCPS